MKREVVQAGPEPSPIAMYLSDAIKAAPFVFASGILTPTDPSTDPYHSAIRAQTDMVFKRLGRALEAGGSSLGESVRLGSFHTRLDDLASHLEMSHAFFPKLLPPTAVVECGLVRPTAVVEVDAIGLIRGSAKRETIVLSTNAPAPYEHAVRAGPFVFTSGVTATDWGRGIPREVETPAGLPYFSSSIKRQTAWVLDRLAALLEAGGSSLENVVKAQIVLPDLDDFFAVDEVWRSYFQTEPPARTVFQAGLVDPWTEVEIDLIAIAPGSGITKQVIEAKGVPVPTTAEVQAVRAGDFVFTSGLLPTDFQTGIAPEARVPADFQRYGSAIKNQVGYILSNLERILEAAGSSRANVVKVGAYHTHLSRDLLGAMQVRRAFFGDGAPASSTVQVPGVLVPEALFMFDAIAVVDET